MLADRGIKVLILFSIIFSFRCDKKGRRYLMGIKHSEYA